jgi:aspartyl protease family protein
MGLKQILPLFGVAVLIGWFMPTDEPVAMSGPTVSQAQSAPPVVEAAPLATAPTPQTVQQPAPLGGVVLNREENGHFFAQGEVDGASVRFMVDTGASVIALTSEDAQKLGQTWYPNELQTVGRGVNGDVIGKPVMLNRVRIGNLEVSNVRAIIVPEGLDVSLLGQSFLSKIQNVNISGDRMTLG